jgi:hypothetical protein
MVRSWIVLVLIVVLTACSSSSTGEFSATVLIDELESSGLTLESTSCDVDKLNNAIPQCYRDSTKTSNTLYVYEFNSNKGVKKALNQLEEDIRQYNVVMPQIFELNNILILYYTNEVRTDPYKDREPRILQAVEKIISKKEAVH